MKLHFRNINPQIERNNFANSEMKVTFATTHVAWCTKLARTFRSTLVIDWTYVCEAVLLANLIAFRVLWLLAERPKARVVGVRGWLGGWVAGCGWLSCVGWLSLAEMKADILDVLDEADEEDIWLWLTGWLTRRLAGCVAA